MTEGLVEVVAVECAECGVISNDLTDWECRYDEVYDNYYYLCPECTDKWEDKYGERDTTRVRVP
ncbi:unnamed protein product [marine sediment metagenome]|uniref:Uncharacterized protein n=1 Tax=marine sediment metagenome TaxID=412755 RepID=X1J2T9_9ZZZZ